MCGKEATSTYCPTCEEKVLETTRNTSRQSGIALFERRSFRQAITTFVVSTIVGLSLGFLFLRSILSLGDIFGVVLFTSTAFAALFGEVKVRFLGYEEVYFSHRNNTVKESWETVTFGRTLSLAVMFLIFLLHWLFSGDPIIVPLFKLLAHLSKSLTLTQFL